MSKKLLPLILCFACVLAFADDDKKAPKDKKMNTKKKSIPWQDDPVCRMVFFAVLEGLYEDGVPNEVVSLVVPDDKQADSQLKTSFVFACPLCHPVFEAFRLYKQRQPFVNKSGRDTFGKGLDPKLVKELEQENINDRLMGLAKVLQVWITRRMKMMRLSDDEVAEWNAKIQKRSAEGKSYLMEYLGKETPEYKGWSLYYGCAACNATTDTSQKLVAERHNKKQAPKEKNKEKE